MGIDKSKEDEQPLPDTAADRRLRDEEYEKTRNPDTELRLDGEKDSLYDDGLDIDEDTDTLAGTRGSSPPSGIKP